MWCCDLLFVNIIRNVLCKLYKFSKQKSLNVELISHTKNHSGPIIAAMAVCICMASAVHC